MSTAFWACLVFFVPFVASCDRGQQVQLDTYWSRATSSASQRVHSSRDTTR
jgi:hypothetical protein